MFDHFPITHFYNITDTLKDGLEIDGWARSTTFLAAEEAAPADGLGFRFHEEE